MRGDAMITFDYNYFMEEHIGSEHGIAEADLASAREKAAAALERMEREKGEGMLGFLDLPSENQLIDEILSYRDRVRADFDTVALVGIGGSALGPQALRNALCHLFLNELDDERREGCKIYFYDNVDPYEILSMADVVDVKKTLFLIISKSGGTTETNANFAILLDYLKKAVGESYRKHIVAITDPQKGILRKIADDEGFTAFPVPSNVGGRFSVLSAVGLVMAAFAGIDIAGLLQGGRHIIDTYYGKDMHANAPLLNAVFHYLFDTLRNKRINVLMPYTRKLFLFADWYRQIWAESLGKETDIAGKKTVVGLTPVSALGTIDQHSQLQLYLEGPNDKVITFLKLRDFECDVEIPGLYPENPELMYLSQKSLRKLNEFEESATELVLKEKSRPNASITLSRLDAENIGALILFIEMQTAYAGYLYNINPYDQPAVEQGKRFTFGLMDRAGYEEYKEVFARNYSKLDKYIL